MFLFGKKTKYDFSDEKISNLTESIIDLKDISGRIGTSIGFLELNNILSAAMKKDPKAFRKATQNNELFGGMGALWETYSRNPDLQSEFDLKMKRFCIILKSIGLRNNRVNQIAKSL